MRVFFDDFFIILTQAQISDPFEGLVDPITSYGSPAYQIGSYVLIISTVFLFVYAVYKAAVGEARGAIITLAIGLVCLSIYGAMEAFL